MAGDSMREQSVNQSSIMFPKTLACQTSSTSTQSKASQADKPDTASQSAQTDQNLSMVHSSPSSCLVENCFCSSSQTRAKASMGYRLLRTAGSLLLFVFKHSPSSVVLRLSRICTTPLLGTHSGIQIAFIIRQTIVFDFQASIRRLAAYPCDTSVLQN
jgi:hypothetical protein